MGSDVENETVTIDDRGRITLPKQVRDRLQIGEGDDLDVEFEDGEIHLRPDRPRFEPVTSGKRRWGSEAFMDAGDALFGDFEDGNVDAGQSNRDERGGDEDENGTRPR